MWTSTEKAQRKIDDRGPRFAELGRARPEARRDFDEKTSILRAAVLRAVEENRAEAEIAREAGIDRMTVREWSGKRRTRTQQEERSAS
jgi:DNA invertase Pin-like site-specific DNA recombinase